MNAEQKTMNKWSGKWIWNDSENIVYLLFNYQWLKYVCLCSLSVAFNSVWQFCCSKFNFTALEKTLLYQSHTHWIRIIHTFQSSRRRRRREKKYDLWCELLILHNCNGQRIPNQWHTLCLSLSQNDKIKYITTKKKRTKYAARSFE